MSFSKHCPTWPFSQNNKCWATHWKPFFFPSILLPSGFFFLDLTLYKKWQIVSLKALWMQQYPNVPGACEHLDMDKHTIVHRLERVKWLNWTASVNPWGKSSVLWCVISWPSGEVCVGVCLCVCVCQTWALSTGALGALNWLVSDWWLHLQLRAWAVATMMVEPLTSLLMWIPLCVCSIPINPSSNEKHTKKKKSLKNWVNFLAGSAWISVA